MRSVHLVLLAYDHFVFSKNSKNRNQENVSIDFLEFHSKTSLPPHRQKPLYNMQHKIRQVFITLFLVAGISLIVYLPLASGTATEEFGGKVLLWEHVTDEAEKPHKVCVRKDECVQLDDEWNNRASRMEVKKGGCAKLYVAPCSTGEVRQLNECTANQRHCDVLFKDLSSISGCDYRK